MLKTIIVRDLHGRGVQITLTQLTTLMRILVTAMALVQNYVLIHYKIGVD